MPDILFKKKMKAIVIYYSKTGNTKKIADTISQAIDAKSYALNIIKKGRKTKEEKELEKKYFNQALDECKLADFVFIGTPTKFRKPHPIIIDFIECIEVKKVAVFCTYYGMLGATFYDLEARLLQKDIEIIDKLKILVGTEKYKFKQDIRQYKELIKPEHLQNARQFALEAVNKQNPLELRLKGVCCRECSNCSEFNRKCRGAAFNCWSAKNCEIFNCCVIKKSFSTCEECGQRLNCNKIRNIECNFAQKPI